MRPRMVDDLESSRRIRWIERRSDHATIARQAMAKRAKNPRAEPTAMNTVPSGKFDFCINGELAVGGTVGAG